MTYQPAVPEAGQSPYPLEQPTRSQVAGDIAEIAEADPEAEGEEDAAEMPGSGAALSWKRPAALGAGAAIGIGSAALVAALLYSRHSAGSARRSEASATAPKKRRSKARKSV